MTTTTATDMVPTSTAVTRLQTSLAKGSLGDLVRARRRSLMLVDVSSSMNSPTPNRERKIDALRTTVTAIRETHAVPGTAATRTGMSAPRAPQAVPRHE